MLYYKWDSNKALLYTESLNQHDIREQLNNLTSTLTNVHNNSELENNLNGFYKCLESVCGPIFKRKRKKTTVNYMDTKNTWYDVECKNKQTEFYRKLNRYRNVTSNANRKEMVNARSCYKHTIRRKKHSFNMLQVKRT